MSDSDDDSSRISSIGSDDSSELNSKKSEHPNVSNDFKEKIILWIHIDDLVRKKQEEIKELKNKREEIDEYILKVLDKNDSDFVDIPGGKLVKNLSERKGTLKVDIIKESIQEVIKKEKLTDSDEISKKLLDDVMDLMETKRGKVQHVDLKRQFTKKNTPSTRGRKKK